MRISDWSSDVCSSDLKEHGALTGSISAAHDALEVIKRQKSAADAIIEVGKDIARKTREARGRVVRRVFNDELNSVWRDLFVRLSPEEPFIPAFATPESVGADIEAGPGTHPRRGRTGKYAQPRVGKEWVSKGRSGGA